ncbi:kinase-like protein [Thelephora ganbajun]|uniref:Kinase-like protein n=1 Tax=Thelephora ganbajun TaxID=370292 RepID=A0ACB6Z7Y9_THEGA|nr:kinase-like protein [Thelephora ganbajun]
MLDSLPPQIYGKHLRYLYRSCGHNALLPTSLQIPLCYDQNEPAHGRGGFADVWKVQHNGQDVAAKALKVYSTDNFKEIRRKFCREVMIWRTLRHPNVLSLLGVMMTENKFVMVSEWMDNGNINKFLKKGDTNVDRVELIREITGGLIYMHDRKIVHGDLKGENIMIDKGGHARLADFSLITVIPDPSTFVSTCVEGGTPSWMSPELLDPEEFGFEEARPTKESDCYALGMVIYEVLSGQAPFPTCGPYGPLKKILRGERPARPEGELGKPFTNDIWETANLCWKPQPSDRASARDVLRCFGGTPPLQPPSPNANVDTEADSDDQSEATPDGS